MRRAVRLAAAALAAVVGLGFVPGARAAEDPFPGIGAAYLVSVHGRVLWERRAEQRLAPASLTKIMTALLVLEHERANDVVQVGRSAAAETGSRLGLAAGERVRVSDLLAAALIASANDACHALADWHSGSERAFVERMNHRDALRQRLRSRRARPLLHRTGPRGAHRSGPASPDVRGAGRPPHACRSHRRRPPALRPR
jgi:D-alanyl-D-alanine carboxypeptidase (penicillin-binding protein 5/6)